MKDGKIRVAIYIDGSNLYHKLKDFGVIKTSKFNYLALCNFLAGDRKIIPCRYYVGVVRAKDDDKFAQAMRSEQQRLFSNLKNQGFCVKQGYLMENNGKFHEKGVDVKIAVDLLVGAYDDLYDVAILISSDTDLIPVISKIKHLNKRVEYIGFAHNPSIALQKIANNFILLTKNELLV